MSTAVGPRVARVGGAAVSAPEQLRRWRLRVRLRQVIVAEAVAAVAISLLGWRPWWVPVTVAVVVLAVAVIAYDGVTAAGWIVRALRWARQRGNGDARARLVAIPEPVTVDLPGVGAVGLVWDGQYAITMIALHGRAYAPTFLDPSGAKTEDMAPLQVAASLLRQFGGLELAAVDVVSAGRRTTDARYASIYDEIVGDRPAVGLRHTWLVLRLCPQACLAAMAYRGDTAAAAAAATERMRQAVLRSGCRAVTCTAEQITAATETLLGGVDLGAARQAWSRLDAGRDYVTSYRVSGRDLSSDWVNDVWAVRSRLTVLTVRCSADAGGDTMVSALVRFHTAAPLTHPPVLELRAVPGQALCAVLTSLPLGNRSLALPLSARRLDAAPLEIPLAPAGFMIGTTTRTGLPLLLSLHDPLKLTRVGVSAELSVVQQLVLRATATGSTVLVHTRRPQAWRPICGEAILLEDPGAGHAPVSMVVLDGDDVSTPAMAVGERGHTIVSVTSSPPGDSDVVIAQISGGQLQLTTPRVANVALTILRPRNETQVLAHLRGAPAPVAR
jgi:type VII secretion protein EccE